MAPGVVGEVELVCCVPRDGRDSAPRCTSSLVLAICETTAFSRAQLCPCVCGSNPKSATSFRVCHKQQVAWSGCDL